MIPWKLAPVIVLSVLAPLAVNVVNVAAAGVTLPITPWKLAPVTVFNAVAPLTVSPVNVPTLVIFVCAALAEFSVPYSTALALPIVAAFNV